MKRNGNGANGRRHATQQSLNGDQDDLRRDAALDTRTPEEILDLIEQKQKETANAIGKLRAIH
jgi:hypothetical protein